MKPYHKIQTVYKRDPKTKRKTLLMGEYSLPEFEYLAWNEWVFTEKIDGTNIRISANVENKRINVNGRTNNAQIPVFLLDAINERFDKILDEFIDMGELTLYGEGYGNKIQKVGSRYMQSNDFILFDVKFGDTWLQRHDVEDIAEKLQIKVVPIIGKGTLHDLVDFVKPGFDSVCSNQQLEAEGVVARPTVEMKDRRGHRIITKLKCADFQNVL